MADTAQLDVQKRSETGSASCRRLRREGLVPANLYGHKQAPTAVTATESAVQHLVHSGVRVLDVNIEGKIEKALLRDVQWDTLGSQIQHVDLMRIDTDERVTVDIPIELRGTAAGVMGGGILNQPLHSIAIDCLVHEMPSHIGIRVNDLGLGDAVHVGDLELPPSANAHVSPETIVVQVVAPAAEVEEEEGEAGPVEPEVIGRKEQEEESA